MEYMLRGGIDLLNRLSAAREENDQIHPLREYRGRAAMLDDSTRTIDGQNRD